MADDRIVCRACNEALPQSDFFPSSLRKSSRVCRDCACAQSRKRYKAAASRAAARILRGARRTEKRLGVDIPAFRVDEAFVRGLLEARDDKDDIKGVRLVRDDLDRPMDIDNCKLLGKAAAKAHLAPLYSRYRK